MRVNNLQEAYITKAKGICPPPHPPTEKVILILISSDDFLNGTIILVAIELRQKSSHILKCFVLTEIIIIIGQTNKSAMAHA
jgi:hypothetical protein